MGVVYRMNNLQLYFIPYHERTVITLFPLSFCYKDVVLILMEGKLKQKDRINRPP